MRLTLTLVAALLVAVPAHAQERSLPDTGRIAGHVVGAYSELMTGVTVTLGRVNDQDFGFRALTATTDNSGAFSFEQLPPGRYRVMASKQGYTDRQLPTGQTQVGAPRFETGSAVALSEGAQVLDVQVVMHRTASMAFVEATVCDAQDQPCAHATGTFKYVPRLPIGPKGTQAFNVISTD